MPPVILWFRRDLRLDDHPALIAAAAGGRPVLPVFIHDETVETLGAAARLRLGRSVAALQFALAARGLTLILRRGLALAVLTDLVARTGARDIHWTRYYEPAHIARDRAVKGWARGAGLQARSFAGALLHEPARLLTGAGQPYQVFTPFWQRLRAGVTDVPLPPPPLLRGWAGADDLPGDRLADWQMERAMRAGAAAVGAHVEPGEAAALARLDRFLDRHVARYEQGRDRPDLAATSGLSDALAWGEVSPLRIWHAALRVEAAGASGVGIAKFLSELAWRDFAWHQMAHRPDLALTSWRGGWDAFPWQGDGDQADRWRRGQTGIDLVDAGMRELWLTGRMHNRVRMIAASFLTKHLLTDWRVGLAWFADCLTDWDPAANAMNWQWVAGSGPDAAPYFRIFNPDTQAARFDPDGTYRRRYLGAEATTAFLSAAPRAWAAGEALRRAPVIPLALGRTRALEAFARFRTSGPS